jgi:hypothetical protein
MGWWNRNVGIGTVVQPIVKGQGLKAGEAIEKIGGPIRFLSVTREPLDRITPADVAKEGFTMTPEEFVSMFVGHNAGCNRCTMVTRIEFEYV